MPTFGRRSEECLATCDDRIQFVARRAIKIVDFSVTDGYRSDEEQDRLYTIGRTAPGRIVTYHRGGQSIHNELPSPALDFAPYPIDWNDLVRFGYVAGIMKHIAWEEDINMIWGGHWVNFKDYPHIQLVRIND
ncbi:MAG: M15 family metallopeptidase [Candidatus Peribacteraceae bacterium]|nr:M15 family metallopeptidase [Candidatus Peribacteraceae bacterium]